MSVLELQHCNNCNKQQFANQSRDSRRRFQMDVLQTCDMNLEAKNFFNFFCLNIREPQSERIIFAPRI